VVAVAGTALLGLAWGTSGTLSSWTAGQVLDSTDTAGTGGIAVTHAYGSTCVGAMRTASQACAASLTPATALPATSVTDSITNDSGRSITQSVTARSCAPVQLADSATSTNPLLPRNDIAFSPGGGPGSVSGSGAVALGTTGYATDTTAQTVGGTPGGLISLVEYDYGYGVWFKTTATTGRLFGLASNPSNTSSTSTTTYDRTLSLSAGKLVFAAAGAPAVTSSGTVNDGSWHYAYVSLTSSAITLVLGLTVTTKDTVYVDGSSVGSASGSSSLSTPTGYWSVGGGFAGSLSGFADYNGTSSPTSPPASPYSGATDVWPLNDSGYSTYAGTMPTGMTTPCARVAAALTFASPSAGTGMVGLGTLASTTYPIAAPAAGATQTMTITTSQGPGYTSDLAGLHLYVPLVFSYGTSPATGWTLMMQWAGDARDVVIA